MHDFKSFICVIMIPCLWGDMELVYVNEYHGCWNVFMSMIITIFIIIIVVIIIIIIVIIIIVVVVVVILITIIIILIIIVVIVTNIIISCDICMYIYVSVSVGVDGILIIYLKQFWWIGSNVWWNFLHIPLQLWSYSRDLMISIYF